MLAVAGQGGVFSPTKCGGRVRIARVVQVAAEECSDM
jgi:hypothetical protein